MAAAAVWIIALVAEYQFCLRPPGDGSALYQADQAAFTLAQLGYLLMLVGLSGRALAATAPSGASGS